MPLNWAVNVTKALFIATVVPGRDEEMVTLLPYFATIKNSHLRTEVESLVEFPKGFLVRGVTPPNLPPVQACSSALHK